MFRLMIAGGGTGGHLYPGIAVAEEAIKDGSEVLFVGTEKGIEARVLPREGFTLKTIRAGKFKGVGVADRMRTMLTIPMGIADSVRIIKGFRPDAALGVGGYASFPALVAARLMGVPVVIQEQNAYPGLTNRTLGRFASAVALGFREAGGFFPAGRARHTGNPIRAGLLSADRAKALTDFGMEDGRTTVLVFGGSGGAHRINKAVAEVLPYLKEFTRGVQFIHQTGEKDLDMVNDAYKNAGFTATVLPFIYDMAGAYACADLALCRSGALTLAELTVLGKPALLIPYPYAANNHQEVNARALEKAGAARVILDSEASGERLAGELIGLINDRDALLGLAGRSLTLGRADAARRVLDICIGVSKGN